MHPRAMSSAKTQLTGKRQVARRCAPGAADRSTRLKLVRPRALLATGDGPKMAPGCVVTTSWPAAARAMASSKAAILVMVYGSELGSLHHRGVLALEPAGGVEEGAGADGDHPAHAQRLGRVEDVLRALDVHGLEVGKVLARPTEERGTVDGGVGPGGGPRGRRRRR